MSEPTLYLFDGYNLVHAGALSDARALIDRLASFLALRGARGVVVFDGHGEDETLGPLEVRYAADADALLERLSVEYRDRERVCLVSSDATVRGISGHQVAKIGSRRFAARLAEAPRREQVRSQLGDRLDDETRRRLEHWRRARRS